MKHIAIIILLLLIIAGIAVYFKKYPLFPEKKPLDFSGPKTLTVDDNGLNYRITSGASTVEQALAEKNIQIGEQDEIIPAKSTSVLPGMNIIINRQAAVKIAVDGEILEKSTLAKTVLDVLDQSEIPLSPFDKVDPSLDTRLSDGMEINITRISEEEVTEEEPIEFSEIEQKDSQTDWGQQLVSQVGENGIREITYKIHYKNGKETSRVKLSSKITKKPTPKIVKIGTRIRVGKSASGIASWYNAGKDECASRDYPPGTWLRVTNRSNGKQVFAKVAGYGPQAGTGKLIDLDNAAFKKIAPLGQGTTKVKVEEILNKGFDPDKK